MADCQEKRDASRERRSKRRAMVHAAGCVYELCPERWYHFDIRDSIDYAQWIGVRIPRSLRRHWGLEAKP